jgi:restriction system protein
MAIPDYQTLMLPALRCLADGRIRVVRDVVEELADRFGLTDADRAQLLPSGGTLTFASRVGWAKTYLKKARLLTQPKRGNVQISPKGIELLAAPPDVLNTKFLDKFESFRTFRNAGRTPPGAVNDARPAAPLLDQTPEEVMDTANVQLRAALADEVLDRVKACPPAFFEQLVVQLLIRMGYGGSREEAGRAVGRSGDGGIDGIINEDRLGLDAIYLQAKRWEGSVGEGPVRDFKGALDAKGAQKGVFITTSTFTPAAKDAARNSRSYKIVLIDGARLADLMIEHDLGVSVAATYQLKRIDSDFFADE